MPRSLGDLKPNWLLSFALKDRCPLLDLAGCHDINDLHPNQVTAPQFAVDRHVEEREIAVVLREFKPDTDRPDVFWLQRALLADDPALVPGRAAGPDGG